MKAGPANEETIEMLKKGAVGILPTDTLYGVVGSALSKKTVERVYQLKKRSPQKPMIILICSPASLKLFKVKVNQETKKLLSQFWPGKVSIILPCPSEKFSYLHRGSKKLGFRVPATEWLRNLLLEAGPLVAPSANPENLPPARTVREAQKYFGRSVDFYLDKGKLSGRPSTLIEIKGKKIIIKREGADVKKVR